jgi:hypothetical protein
MGSRELAAVSTPLAFDPMLSSADVDLAELAERVRAAPTKALSFCLSGPPRTGKSAYARHLTEKLEMETVDRRYSDLISSYFGDSEKAMRAVPGKSRRSMVAQPTMERHLCLLQQIETVFCQALGIECPEFVVRLDGLTPGTSI